MSDALSPGDAWSPAPILDATDRYRGRIIDLDAGRRVSADAFARGRETLIAAFRRHGLAGGDRVLMALPNSALFMATLTALLACEASPLLVHWQTPPAELLRYARRFGTRFLATANPAGHPVAIDTERLPFLDPIELAWGRVDIPDEAPPGPILRGVPLHPTSGSTGLPKIALRPGFAAMEEARHYAATMAIDEDDTILTIPPLSHAYGYGCCGMMALLTGATLVTTARFSTRQMIQVLPEHAITVLPNVPANIDLLLFGGNADYGRLRWMLTAGSMLPRRSADLFRKKTGVTVCPLYGTTETGGIAVATAADGRDVDGRVGPPMEGVEVRVVPREQEAGVEPGIGKLWVRSSSMMSGYLDEHGKVTSPFQEDWFETGDLARMAEDGVIHLRGRTGEMINVLGLKVVPCEVEEAIACMPGVREVKVYAGTTGKNEIVKAAVAVENNITTEEIRAYCEQQLTYYKRPQSIALVDALPRNPAGKILSDQLP